MLTSNVKKHASIEFITQKKHKKWCYMIWLCVGRLWPLSDLYHVTLTSKKLKIIIFQLGTADYLNLDTKTTKLTRVQPYLYCQWPFWIYANYRGLTHPKRCVLYQDLICTYSSSSVPMLVLSCRNEHSGIFFRLRQRTKYPRYTTTQLTQLYKWVPGHYTDSGGNVSDLVVAAWLECFPEKPSWCRNEQVWQGGGGKQCKALWAVQRTGSLYKNFLHLFFTLPSIVIFKITAEVTYQLFDDWYNIL